MSDIEEMKLWLGYDAETGVLTWLQSSAARIHAGDVAGHRNVLGYRTLNFKGRRYQAHHVAWAFHHGRWPAGILDHINGERDDNRVSNLREVTASENAQNKRRARSDNSTGVLGVTRNYKRFRAQIGVGGKLVNLGSFATVEEASAAYLAAKRELHSGNTL